MSKREPAELLAVGTPHGVDWESVARATAEAALSSPDAGWMLAGLPTPMEYLMRLKYMGERRDGAVMYGLLCDVVGHALNALTEIRSVGPKLTVDDVEHISAAVIHETIGTGVCGVCNGRKSAMIGNTLVECEPCAGSGKESYRERRDGLLAKYRGERSATELFDRVSMILHEWEMEGVVTVARRSKDER